MAYPGSKLYSLAIQEGWALPQTWQDYSPYAYETLPLPTKYLGGNDVLRFRDQAFQIYFHQARYLEMITQKFGPESARHIRAMVSRPLDRAYRAAAEKKKMGAEFPSLLTRA
jgi:anaerobic magnesium-protoporphyrin IX monomethyl ester cyclase